MDLTDKAWAVEVIKTVILVITPGQAVVQRVFVSTLVMATRLPAVPGVVEFY
jgi:hypothetical protein